MRPVIRQNDGTNEEWSDITGLDCSESKDMTRQEDKQATDVKYILERFGITPNNKQELYVETDYSLDLQDSLQAVKDAQTFHNNLPQALRAKYTWRSMLDAVANGQLAADLTDIKKPTNVTPPKPEA